MRKTKSETEIRNQIVEKTSYIFVDRGYKKVTIKWISDTFHISNATIYRLFGNKKQLFFACLHHVIEKETRLIIQGKKHMGISQFQILETYYMTCGIIFRKYTKRSFS